jgi:hypothetical protein
MIRYPVDNPRHSLLQFMMAILLLLLCGLAFITNVAGGFIYVVFVAALIMFAIHFIKTHWNRPAQLQPALGFYRLNATATHERNAAPSHHVTNRIRHVV